MTGFSLDYTDVYEGTGGRIADGDYEVIIKSVKEDVTPGGAEYVEFDVVIRNDFDQPHKNMHVFHKVWKAKETGKYNMKSFNTMGKAFQLQNGKTYNSFKELLDDFVLMTARANIKTEKSEYNGKEYENYRVFFNQSKLTGVSHNWNQSGDNSTNPAPMGQAPVEISDDDLPF